MSQTPDLEDKLRKIDLSIDELASEGEFDALSSRLASDFRYNHSTGLSQNKSEWLEGLRPLVGKRQRVASAVQIEVHGEIAVVMGDLDITWNDGRQNYDRYVRIYRLEDGHWLAIHQRTVPALDRSPTVH